MRDAFDIAVVGSGFAGSLFALIARRLGRSVVMVEKAAHPRFTIGESSAPLANLLLEELSDRYQLDRVRPLASWGSWQRTYPEIGCGLKRGFTFYGHRAGEPFRADPWRRDQLLVAASPSDEVADTHWYRADFDHFLQREAQASGAEYLDRTRLDHFEKTSDGVAIEGSRRGGDRIRLTARLLVDASGPRGFLHQALALPESRFPDLPDTEGLYAHFEGVRRLADTETFSFACGGRPPFPIDDAAVHHVFEGGWVWVLRFQNGLTSAGVAAAPGLSRELDLAQGQAAWGRLLTRFPSIGEQFAGSRAVRPFDHAATLPFRSAAASGRGWLLLPGAAAFVDPMLSTGFPLTLLGIARLSRAVEKSWGRPEFESAILSCGRETLAEADSAALLVAALYAAFSDFELFAALTLLYFAASSFTEAAHRLSRPQLCGAFLCADHPTFGPALRRCCTQVLDAAARRALVAEKSRLIDDVYRAIDPLDVAGLSDRGRRNWHPMEARPLSHAAHKLGASRREVDEMLVKSGLVAESAPA